MLLLALCLRPAIAQDGASGGDGAPLSFAFLETVPGELVSIGPMRLHLDCGEVARDGEERAAREPPSSARPTVLFEAGLGGSALEWRPVIEALGAAVRCCAYDRAGYGWSDPSARPRDARQLADELDRLLDIAGIDGPLVVVAHSFGGFVARLFAERRHDIAGLLLLDTSHEEQFARLERAGERPMMPRNRQFVISQNAAPESLPRELRRKVGAFNRMRKTYSATHGEMSAFRESAEQVRAARARRGEPFPFPVTVVRRGLDLYAGRTSGAEKTAAWIELQEDLAGIGRPGRLVIAEGSGHHLHTDDPALVAAEIERLLARLGPGEAR